MSYMRKGVAILRRLVNLRTQVGALREMGRGAFAAPRVSHLQACGIINDHGCGCPRYAVVNAATETVRKRHNHEQGVVNFVNL